MLKSFKWIVIILIMPVVLGGCITLSLLIGIFAAIGDAITVEPSYFSVDPHTIPSAQEEISAPPQPAGNSAATRPLAAELQWLAVKTACLGIYNAGQTGSYAIADPVDYYKPSSIRTYLTETSGNQTQTALFYGICFNYAQRAYDEIMQYIHYYGSAGVSAWYIAAAFDNAEEIFLFDPVSHDRADAVLNGVSVKQYASYKIKTHDEAKTHAWLWVYGQDGIIYWIDPTWTDNTGYPYWGIVQNGQEIGMPPERSLCIENLNPNSSGYAAFNSGNAKRNLGNFTGAIKDFTTAIQADPDEAVFYCRRGLVYLEQKNYKKAIEDFDQAIALNPGYSQAWLNRGTAYGEDGNTSLALSSFDQVIAIVPNDADAYYNRGYIYQNMGKTDLAMADYNKAISLNPNYVGAYNNRAVLYGELKEYAQAEADLTYALSLAPSAMLYYNRGKYYLEYADYDKCIADCSKAVMLDKRYALAYYNRGAAYAAKGQSEQAAEDYTHSIKLDPKYPDAYYNRGILYLSRNTYQDYLNAPERVTADYDRAISDFTEAIALNSKTPSYYHNRGIAYSMKKENRLAIADYTKAVSLNPNNADVYNLRGMSYEEQGDYKNALADFKTALQLNPNHPFAGENKTRVLKTLGY